ncbi:type II secretion system F family protein [Candidatus Woesearchaeota archaeon]|nr:type II secretion system F family protein [Candidatus Woesearchaeota archaeon]
MAAAIFKRISDNLPGLGVKLQQAGFLDEPADFVQKTAMSAFYITTGIMLVLAAVFVKLNVLKGLLVFMFPILFIMTFFYFLKAPEVIILKKEREIEREIVFAGRFLVIEMESGVPLYETIRNVAGNYETIGKYFKEIIDKVDLGTPLEDAIGEEIELTPSANFRKLLWQVLNSLKTGADISKSINSTIDQVAREQMIEVREYGRKLNPIAMFYMIIAVIMPSIGVVMLIILASFVSLKIDLASLLAITGFLAFLQFMFLAMIRSQRPAVEI